MGEAFPAPVAAALVFVASGAVLVLEILGVRLLAPYVGLTLETTTSIIGAVLAGIAAAIDDNEPGDEIEVTVRSGGDERTVTVTLGERPTQSP